MSDQNKQQDDLSGVLNILGFGNGKVSEARDKLDAQQLPEECDTDLLAAEKHKHALKIILANGTVKDFLGEEINL